MAFLREIPKVKDPNDNKQLLNYIYALEEQLRYVYANLGAENLIDGAGKYSRNQSILSAWFGHDSLSASKFR